MPTETLDRPTEVIVDSPAGRADDETELLFKEARRRRRRRRKRLLLGGLFAGLGLAVLLSTLLAVGGLGGSGGGPGRPVPPLPRHGSPGGQVVHQPSSATPAHRAPSASGPALCGERTNLRAGGNATGVATLLPCFKATLPSGVQTTTP